MGIIALIDKNVGSMEECRKFGGVWMIGEFLVVGSSMGETWKKWGNVWGEVREGVGRCVGGVGKYGKVWGMGSRCVEVCLGCVEKCGKSVGVGQKGVGLGFGKGRCREVLEEMWDNPGKCWEKDSVTIWDDPNPPTPTPLTLDPNSSDPSSPDPNPPDSNSPDPAFFGRNVHFRFFF